LCGPIRRAAEGSIAKMWGLAENIPLKTKKNKQIYENELKIKNEYDAVGIKIYKLTDKIKKALQNLVKLSL
jgi:hypothetical protein